MIHQERLLYKRLLYYVSIVLALKLLATGLAYSVVRFININVMIGVDMILATVCLMAILILLGNTFVLIKHAKDNAANDFDPYIWGTITDRKYIELLHYCEDRIQAGMSLNFINRILKHHDWRIEYATDKNVRNLCLYSLGNKNNEKFVESIKFSKNRGSYVNIALSKVTKAIQQYCSDNRISQKENLLRQIIFSLDFLTITDINRILAPNLVVKLKQPSNIYDIFDTPILQSKTRQKEELLDEVDLIEGW